MVKAQKPTSLEKGALRISKILRREGFEIFYAGGCVRDKLLRQTPPDIDLATSAEPKDVLRLFPKAVNVGEAFGVVRILVGKHEYEIATFRKDLEYKDHRHPEGVVFASAEEDATRRDFTVNAMFSDPFTQKIVDYVGGRKDLKAKTLRAVGIPEKRFKEDALRLLRALRFSARLGLRIEKKTWVAIQKNAGLIRKISQERIREELTKMFAGKNPEVALDLLDKSGLLRILLPGVSKMKGVKQPAEFHPEGDVFVHTRLLLQIFGRSRNRKQFSEEDQQILAWSCLLHDIGKPPTFKDERKKGGRIRFNRHAAKGAIMGERVMEKLKFPKKQTETVRKITAEHLKFIDAFRMKQSTLRRFLRTEHFLLLLELHRIDCLASHGKLDAYYFCKKAKETLGEEKLRPKRLLTGNDLKTMGLKPGPVFKEILTALETEQLEGRLTSKRAAAEWVKKKWVVIRG